MATIDIFNLSPRDFNLQMQEEAMYRTPAELDELRREYRNRNSMAGKLMGLLAPEEGKRRSTFLPVDAPQGMSIFDALRSGQATPAVPQGLVDLITGGTRGVESAREYAQGVPPRADALNDALAMSGLAMTGGGVAASTLRPKKPSLPNAPKERGDMILNMLKDGDAANITDDMFDMGDSVKTTQLNQYLFENYDLPMDAESRAQRLFQMGYRREGMHGTSKERGGEFDDETPDILAFRPSEHGAIGSGVYVDPLLDGRIGASQYFAEPNRREGGESGAYYPILTKGKMMPSGNYKSMFSQALEDLGKSGDKSFEARKAADRLVAQRVAEQGFSGMGDIGEYTIIDPANIRSRSARADPRLAHLSNIMAANASKSTGLLTTAASEAQDMAKRILELRAEGRASEVTDEMMAQADPQYMFANTPLPMDEASRMARAEAAGFEGGLLHGTGADIVGVDKDKLGQKQDLLGTGFYSTTSPKRSERYVPKETDPLTEERVFSEGGNVIPLLARNTAQFDLTKPTGIPNAVKIGKAFEGSDFDVEYRGEGDQVFIKSKTDPQMSVYIDSYQDGIATLQKLKDVFGRNNVTNILEEAGFSGLKAEEGFGNITNLNYEPTDVRSRFARFDPEFAHLSNLSAANASPLGGLLAQSGVSDKQAERIEEYLRRRGLLD
jgi:hypothetical protein